MVGESKEAAHSSSSLLVADINVLGGDKRDMSCERMRTEKKIRLCTIFRLCFPAFSFILW